MPRWRQDSRTGRLIPVGTPTERPAGTTCIQGTFDAFHSPVDGSLIASHKALREHNARNGVVDSREYSPEYYQRKAAERARYFSGEHRTPEEVYRAKQQIHELIVRAENGRG